jgi:hypothetical protein
MYVNPFTTPTTSRFFDEHDCPPDMDEDADFLAYLEELDEEEEDLDEDEAWAEWTATATERAEEERHDEALARLMDF